MKDAHKDVVCTFCSKTMRSNNLKRHMKQHSSRSCTVCDKEFQRPLDYIRHTARSSPVKCKSCERTFCYENDLECHQRTDHPVQTGQGAPVDDAAWKEALQQPLVIIDKGHLLTEEYKVVKQAHAREIEDRVEGIEGVYQKVNKEIDPDFTYGDLYKLLLTQLEKQDGHAFKVNLGFGFILFHIHTGEYRYYYNSTNNMLFERAFTVNEISDIRALIQRIIDLDLGETYYMRRPDSSWMLSSLPNIELSIFRLAKALMG